MRGKAYFQKKADTRKIVGRLTYSPEKHKQKCRRAQRKKLSLQPPAKPPKPQVAKSLLTFGSLNVNGLTHEAHWAVTELLEKYTIDVGLFLLIYLCKHSYILLL